VISGTVLIAPEESVAGLNAASTAAAIGRGIMAGGHATQAKNTVLTVDLCPIAGGERDLSAIRHSLDAVDFDARMRAARAVVVSAARLDEVTLLGSATFEIATRARQSGVPAYAVTGHNALSLFDARILDLQVVLEVHNARALRRAGEQLAGLV
jgi:glycerate kinase